VLINGKVLDESSYLDESVRTEAGASIREGVEYSIPVNQYVLIGDNRPFSTDCREFGAVPKEYIEGKALVVWFPPKDAKVIQKINYGANFTATE
jgi:signal peptidase I